MSERGVSGVSLIGKFLRAELLCENMTKASNRFWKLSKSLPYAIACLPCALYRFSKDGFPICFQKSGFDLLSADRDRDPVLPAWISLLVVGEQEVQSTEKE